MKWHSTLGTKYFKNDTKLGTKYLKKDIKLGTKYLKFVSIYN